MLSMCSEQTKDVDSKKDLQGLACLRSMHDLHASSGLLHPLCNRDLNK